MAQHTVGRSGHRVRAHEENGVAALLKCLDVLRTRFEAVWLEAFEAVRASRAVTIHHHDISRPGRSCATHRRVHLVRVQLAALFIKWLARSHLFPGLDTRNTFHVTEDDDTHRMFTPYTFCGCLL